MQQPTNKAPRKEKARYFYKDNGLFLADYLL